MVEKKLSQYSLIALLIICGFVVLLPYWSWSFFDELYWINAHLNNKTFIDFIHRDWDALGRIRPTTGLINYFIKLNILGHQAHLLRMSRFIEIILGAGLYYLILRRQFKASIFVTTLGLLFWLKSQPQLEQFRWMFLSEQIGIIFLLGALALRKKPRFAFICLIFCALTKESFLIFLPILAILDKKWKQAAILTVTALSAMIFMYAHRKGIMSNYSLLPELALLLKIFVRWLVDFIWIIPLLLFAFSKKEARIWKEPYWSSFVFLLFGIGYSVLVVQRAWTYTYYFAPQALLFSLAAFTFFSSVEKDLPKHRVLWPYCQILLCLFSFRVVAYEIQQYSESKDRYFFLESVSTLPQGLTVAMNCPTDTRGVGLASSVLFKTHERPDGPSGCSLSILESCCQDAGLMAVSTECPEASQISEKLESTGAQKVYNKGRWSIYACGKKK